AIGGRPSLGEQAHSLYLQTAAELGIPGLVLMIGVLAAFWWSGIRKVVGMEAGLRRTLLMGALGSRGAVAGDRLASPSWQLAQTSMFFWLILGMGVGAMRSYGRRETDEAKERVGASVPVLVRRPAAVMASLGIAALLPSVAFAGGGGGYATPEYAHIVPKSSSIRHGAAREYKLLVKFSDNT